MANSFIMYGIKRSQFPVNTTTSSGNNIDQRENKNATLILMISSTSVLFNVPDVVYAVLSSYHNDPNSATSSSHLIFRYFLPFFDS